LVPAIVTDAPTAPEFGVRLVIVGVAALTTDAVQKIVRTTRIVEIREAVHDLRFIRKPFLRREHATMPALRLAMNARLRGRTHTAPLRTSEYSLTIEVRMPWGSTSLVC
jgi:hypothetical protein